MTESCAKRVTCKRPHPNQRFRELLETLYQEAVTVRSELVPSLKQAISSVEKYPLPLSSVAECAILKGFDQRLCKYIDLYINGQKKKTKVTDHGNPSCKRGRSQPVKEDSDAKMASAPKKNQKKNKNLVTNSEKCSFVSKFGEASTDTAAHSENTQISTNSQVKTNNTNSKLNNKKLRSIEKKCENNNNTTTSDCPDDTCTVSEPLDNYFATSTRKDAAQNSNEIMQNNCLDDNNFALCKNWDSQTNNDCRQLRKKYDTITKTCYQPIQLVDPDKDDFDLDKHLVTEINSSSDNESTSPPIIPQSECLHNEKVIDCKQCESITKSADAFQLYYKDKVKRDAEEIGKCILPRKMYKPAYRSGAYAILVALLEQRNECPYRDCLTKDELIQKAQKHTDQSFTNPNPESNYTAWTNAKRLISKGMIQIPNYGSYCEDFYMLTAMGRAVAMELVKEHTPEVTINDVIFHGQRNDRVPSLEDVVLVPPPPLVSVDEDQSSLFIEMPPGTFDIVMLVDKREQFKLPVSPNSCVKYESRSLTMGDFLWVARSKKTGQELVLPYIVERKRTDDLSSSIKDGRFHEQKFRLKKCGLKNVLYLVEKYTKCHLTKAGLPISTLEQAMVNTYIQDDFTVVKTMSLDHTFVFLGVLSEHLVHEFLPIFLRGCNRDTQGKELMTFEFFNKFASKNKPLTVKDTFIKMLLQLKGLSVEKALAITNKYNTPRALMKAYKTCPQKEGEMLLAKLKYNNFTRNVGPAVSRTIYRLFSKLEL